MFGEKMGRKQRAPNRLTVSLRPGQRKALEDLAELNGTTLAYVVRFALSEFIEARRDKQIPFRFPIKHEE
jgi:hypothetical protein